MLVALSDTHREAGHGLTGRTLEAVRAADRVLHAGDLTTAAVLDAFYNATERFEAVCGNSDDPAVRERLPDARTLSVGGLTVALTHRREGGATGLAMFGRARGADLVVSGHTHRPSVTGGDPALLNPGSHTSPRGGPPTHAELDVDGTVEVRTPAGAVVASDRLG